ncbi:MAG: AraC family transcriptional regulator, partial [Lachnospiraceae bacterium]|nr:AraC family transcriptional regulator [Lachnospiraceae bacterium]
MSWRTLNNTKDIYSELAQECMDVLSLNISNFEDFGDELAAYFNDQFSDLASLERDELDEETVSDFLDSFESMFLVMNQISGTIPYIYLRSSDYTISTTSSEDAMLTGEITEILGIAEEDWNALISAGDTPVTFIMQTEQMTFARLMISKEVLPGVVLIFAIPEDTITREMDQRYLPANSSVIMITANNQYLLSQDSPANESDYGLNISYEMLESDSGCIYIQDSPVPQFLYYQSIENTEIKISVLIEDDIYPQFYRSVILNIVLSIVFWLIVGGIVSFLLASRLYEPVALLLKNIPIQSEPEEERSDLQQIQSFMDKLQVSNQSYAEKLENQRLILGDNLFWRLVNRAQSWSADTAVFLEEAGFPVSSGCYVLFEVSVLPSPEYDTAQIGTDVYENFDFDQILVKNLEEQGFAAYAIACSDRFLVFTDLTGKDALPGFEQIHSLHPADYPLIFTIAVSPEHHLLEELPEAYSEVLFVIDQAVMQNQYGKTLYYSQYALDRKKAGGTNQFLSSLHLLSGYIQSANFEAAADETNMLSKTISDAKDGQISVSSQLFYIRETVRFSLESVQSLDTDKLAELYKSHPLARSSSQAEFFAELRQFLEALSNLPDSSSSTDSDEIIQEIAAYLQEHYMDPTLSAGAVAEQFDVSISWLSVHFKSEMGIGFLDYLHTCRLLRAKRLLQTESLSIREIALACGYTNSATFSRAFSRYEGVTPST